MPEHSIELRGVSKSFPMGEGRVEALRDVCLTIERGEFAAILGPSGSGKSTLLSILGCLDVPTSGEVYLAGRKVSGMSEPELARVRNREIGFVFQNFYLLSHYDALSNVELPLLYAGSPDARRRAERALVRVGLGDRLRHMPNQLSGGQRQRVAIARALSGAPSVILADEPTGNLDSASGREVLELFQELHRAGGTVILVTHDPQVAALTRRTLRVSDGRVSSDHRSLLGGGT
ncbi:MAG: ABC transporter ATP-binding protein [Elusimicrobia bacterium]|nr:ABC transporter ATP-binding protein [Elusimicrobiota bacterium]